MGTQVAILNRVVRPGMRFRHKQWVVGRPDGSVRPDTCTVTAVRRGVVHFQTEAGHTTQSNPTSFIHHVDHWLDEAA
jgi:hypothetical protein